MAYGNRSRNGFTLIELIVALAIFSIVSIMVYSLLFFGQRSMTAGETRFEMQTTLRQAADAITKQVRGAQTLEILTNVPATFVTSSEYIYIKEDLVTHKKAIYHKLGIAPEKKLCSDLPNNFSLSFQPMSNSQIILNNKILKFQLSTNYKGQSYDLSSQVLMLNAGINYISGSSSGNAIEFGPLSDLESVLSDKAYLSTLIPFTVKGYEIKLPIHGPNGTAISWETTTSGVTVNVDTVSGFSRSESEGPPIDLKATIRKNDDSEVLNFTQTIPKITPLVLDNKADPPYNIGSFKKGNIINYTFHATGGDGIYSYSVITPPTPPGLRIDPITGVLFGTLTTIGNYTIKVIVTDTTLPTHKIDTADYTLNVVNN